MKNFQKIELILMGAVLVMNVFLFVSLSMSGSLTGFSFLNFGNESDFKLPFDFVSENEILFYDNGILIQLENYTLSRYDSSESMVPFLGEGVNGVGIHPKSEEEIHVGDVISFEKDDSLIVHRVVKKGFDKEGVFFITKGDNNYFNDGKIRFSEIDSVLVALIY